MFCFQCQEAAKGVACVEVMGKCGKTEEVSDLQDLLIYAIKGISIYAKEALKLGWNSPKADNFTLEAIFSTITNANFDGDAIIRYTKEALRIRDEIKGFLLQKGFDVAKIDKDETTWSPKSDEDFYDKSKEIGPDKYDDEDRRALCETVVYGVKGMAAYASHAAALGYEKKDINNFVYAALSSTADENLGKDELVALVLETGKFGVETMALLDEANTSTYGNPEISKVELGVRSNPGILVSGHDLKDLEELLEQTQGSGVDVYTHCEMLPAHYYPKFKKYSNFVGNYGNAWHEQKKEFQTFNGPILFTTNCLVPPSKKANYADKVYMTGATGYPGFPYIEKPETGPKDFSQIIEHAKKCDPPEEIESGQIVGGFARDQVMKLGDKIVDAVKSGALKKFVVMAGCDGRLSSRKYYTEFAEELPKDTVILTAGCAKYRYNKLDLGDIGGIPRVLDAGQCNDSYSLAYVALQLKEIFGVDDINQLPIEYNVAWYEQKAVIVLLALLYLGVKNITLGPTLPAFLSPGVAKTFVDTFGLRPIGEVSDDVERMTA